MNLERTYQVITLSNGRKKLTIVFADSNYSLLSTFFFVDYSSFGDWIKQKVTDVVDGREETQDISGNICELVIDKDRIKVYDMLAEDGMGRWCDIATNDMIELMEEWEQKNSQL